MIRDLDAELLREDALALEQFRQGVEDLLVSRQGHGGRAVDGGDPDLIFEPVDERAHLGLREAHRQHPALAGRAREQAAPVEDDAGCVGQAKRSCCRGSRNLSHAVADDGRRRDPAIAQDLGEAHLHQEVQRLRDLGLGWRATWPRP